MLIQPLFRPVVIQLPRKKCPPTGPGPGHSKTRYPASQRKRCFSGRQPSFHGPSHWPITQAILHATAEMRAAPRPLPSSDCRKEMSQPGVSCLTDAWKRSLKLCTGEKQGEEKEEKGRVKCFQDCPFELVFSKWEKKQAKISEPFQADINVAALRLYLTQHDDPAYQNQNWLS